MSPRPINRVVSIVLNEVDYDQRVERVAATLAAQGADVIVLGLTFGERGWDRTVDGARVRVVASPPVESRVEPLVLRGARATSRVRETVTARRKRRQARAGASVERARGTEGSQAHLRRARRKLRRVKLGRVARLELRVTRALARATKAQRRRARLLRRDARLRSRSFVRAGRPMIREVVRLRPDAIHANDAETLPIAVAARRRLRFLGRFPKLIYDAHEWTVGRTAYITPTRGRPSEVELERRFIDCADAVIAVSGEQARRLRSRYQLARPPAVVHNAPPRSWSSRPVPGVRELAGIPTDAPVLAYAGVIMPNRGILESVAALEALPNAIRFVAVGKITPRFADEVRSQAVKQGVAERVCLLDPVRPEEVVATIRDATVGLIPTQAYENYAVTLPNKLFQYVQAGLPIVASDLGELARFVSTHGIGELCRPEDAASLAAAITRAIERGTEIRQRLRDPDLIAKASWEAQLPALLGVYRELGFTWDSVGR